MAIVLSLMIASAFPLLISGISHSSAAATTPGVELSLSARPPILPADGGTYNAVVIQFVATGSSDAVIPSSDVTIQLSSSNAQTGTLPSTITFPAGDLYYDVSFTTTTLPGTTTVYAVAQGYQPANLTLKTETFGGIPTALEVFLSPDQILAQSGTTSRVVVEAVDAFGNPVNLANSITVTLSSSITQVGNVQSPLTIPANQNYAYTTFTATNSSGQSVITASAESLAPGSAVMTTVGSGASIPDSLAIEFAPPILYSDGATHQNIAVEVINANNSSPSPAPGNIIVTLTSSVASVGSVQQVVEIPAGQSYAYATFTTTGLAGNTTITATASDYVTAQGNLGLVTKAATTLGLYAEPSTVIANNQTYNNLIVQLHDPSGSPEKSIVPVVVSLQSLDPSTGTVPPQVTILANSTYASIPLTTTGTTGTINIVAFATGFVLGEVTLNSTLLSLNAAMTPSPAAINVGGSSKVMLDVMSGNFPVSDATVQWSVDTGQISPISSTTNASGYTSAVVIAQTNLTRVLVSARITVQGYSSTVVSANVMVNVISAPKHASGIVGVMTMNLLFLPLWSIIVIAAGGSGGAFFFIRRKSLTGSADYGIDEEV